MGIRCPPRKTEGKKRKEIENKENDKGKMESKRKREKRGGRGKIVEYNTMVKIIRKVWEKQYENVWIYT